MGRVSSIGSSTKLRKALFPVGFAGEVMSLIKVTWRTFSMHRSVKHEEPITALFAEALVRAYERRGWPWMIFPEIPITDPVSGIEISRTDLRFLHRHFRQTVFFTVECKRLNVTTESGFRSLSAEYINEGLMRFVSGKYASGCSYGGLVGYVLDNDLEAAFDLVKEQVTAHRDRLKIKTNPHFHTPSRVLPKTLHGGDTFHDRPEGEIIVHHLLLGVKH